MKRRSLGSILRSNPKWNYFTGRLNQGDPTDCYRTCENGSPSHDMKRLNSGATPTMPTKNLHDIAKAFKVKGNFGGHGKDETINMSPLCGDGASATDAWRPEENLQEDVQLTFEEFLTSVNLEPERVHAADAKGATFLHYAARAGRKDLVEYLVDRGLDMDAKDEEGNTPLHWAVEGRQANSLEALLVMGARADILNKQKMAPLHLACDLNYVEGVQVICSQPNSEINIRGEFGQTAVHYCAMKDNLEAAKKLIEFSPLLCMSDNNGVYPIHCAATHASRKVLDILLTEAEKCGYERWQLLNFKDKEENTALHSAVNGGCESAVQVCLEFGAKLDVPQDNKSTPLHLACGQGALRIVEIMLSNYKTSNTLTMQDIEMRTPLHKAAMFDHVDVVRYLLEQGAELDVPDIEERTPLLLAASRGGWRSVQLLLQKGADFYIKDGEKRNLLHIVILHGGNIRDLRVNGDLKHAFADLLNERDLHGCTPMHYATQRGNIKCVENLIDLGATVNLKDKQKQSPLHFAAKYGRLNSCKRLLDSKIGPNIINDTDGEGMTALHIAARNGHQKVVQLLLLRGALLHKDYKGRTPFHLAAMAGYRETMDILLSTHGHLLDQKDDTGCSPILLAAQEGQPGAVTYLMDHGAALDLTNCCGDGIMDIVFDTHNKDVAVAIVLHTRWDELLVSTMNKNNPIDRLIQHMPDVFAKVLDRCETHSDEDPSSVDYWQKFDFKYLQLPVQLRRKFLKEGCKVSPLCTLNSMVKYNRVELLSHPLSIKYLDMKWKSYGAACHTMFIGIYLFFLAMLTSFVCSTDPTPVVNNTDMGEKDWTTDPHMSKNVSAVSQYICTIMLTCFCSFNILKELVQVVQQQWKYFIDMTNYLEWTLYICTLLYVGPFLKDDGTPSSHFQWECGAVAIFLAWFNFLLYQQRLGTTGIYVVMFLHILKTLIRVVFVFLILVIAFGMSFFILMKQETNNAFAKPHLAIVRVMTMMMGELDYINSFVTPLFDMKPYTMHYSQLSIVFLLIMCILLPILLMNLLIGLAVGDIAAVQRDAQLKRLAMQVDQYTGLEKRLPMSIIERVDKDCIVVFPNRIGKFCWKSMIHTAMRFNSSGEAISTRSTEGEFDPRQMHGEVWKLKKRLKDMSGLMEKQYDLLRLVVQKMEIRSEADERDEGVCTDLSTCRPRSSMRMNLSQAVRLARNRQAICSPSQGQTRPGSGNSSRPGSVGRRSPIVTGLSSPSLQGSTRSSPVVPEPSC
ncbi:LOW QUALITY PROTEIN: transient receptor potential cation channel subfamily A member 1-like [Diadema antillarum]|uniref:LOW QUALITY PROTEIN: transient receptor potential cation channel subfamily A member 1-like n=1 Tax=Diadema antillarum TaxID=105358 RepID=UPI003A844662